MDAIPLILSSKTSGEKVDYPGPKPVESQIPDHVKTLAVDLSKPKLDSSTNRSFQEFRRVANYITAGEHNRLLLCLDHLLICFSSHDLLEGQRLT